MVQFAVLLNCVVVGACYCQVQWLVCVHTQERPSLWHVVRRCWSVPCKPYRLDQGANADGWEEGAGRAEAEVFIHSCRAHTGHAWGDVL